MKSCTIPCNALTKVESKPKLVLCSILLNYKLILIKITSCPKGLDPLVKSEVFFTCGKCSIPMKSKSKAMRSP